MLLLLYLMLTLLLSALCSPACAATSRIRLTMVAHRYFYSTAFRVALLVLLLWYFYISTSNFCFWGFNTSTSTLLLLVLRYYIYCCGDNGGALLSRWRPRWRRLGRPDNPWGGRSTISPSLSLCPDPRKTIGWIQMLWPDFKFSNGKDRAARRGAVVSTNM